MDIQVGKFHLMSDAYCMWIDKEYQGKDKKGRAVTKKKRVAGYSISFEELLRSFAQRNIRGSDARDVESLLADFDQTYRDMMEFREAAMREDFKLVSKKEMSRKARQQKNDQTR